VNRGFRGVGRANGPKCGERKCGEEGELTAREIGGVVVTKSRKGWNSRRKVD